MTDSASSVGDARATRRFSPVRVCLAVLVVAIVAAGVWFGSDAIAKRRATNLFNAIRELMEQNGQATSADVYWATGLEPSHTTPGSQGSFTSRYVFRGLNRVYTVRVAYWQYENDENWYVDSAELFSERSL